MSSLTVFAPAKINLFLAITGRRADGFHDLVSVAAPLAWGDELRVESATDFSLRCGDPAVPSGSGNLILKAAEAFRSETGWTGGAKFWLEKRVPLGAGLGGGSSDAAAALKALNELAGGILTLDQLAAVAARVGSDCTLFLHDGAVVMRGRGEQVTALADAARGRLRGRQLLIFKPAFAISTAWAYARLAAMVGSGYFPPAEADARLAAWENSAAPAEDLLYNNMEPAAFTKFPALPVLLARLRRDFGLAPRMSGSGSACFSFLPDGAPVAEVCATIRQTWGDSAFLVQTRLQ